MLVLALDTSTPRITTAVVTLGRPHEVVAGATPLELLAERSRVDAFGHAEYLMPLVRQVLDDAGRGLDDLDAVVVGLGPGPFTGLRVGVATAQALGDALGVPTHGVPSHDAMAAALLAGPQRRDGDVLIATDARRREVYVAGYQGGTRVLGPLVCAPDLVDQLAAEAGLQPAVVAGAGAALLSGDRTVVDIPALGLGVVRRAAAALLTGAVSGPLTPLYLRRPDAVPPKLKSVLSPADQPVAAP